MVWGDVLTVSSSVLTAAVTVVGAVCVLAKGSISAGVASTFVNVTLTPAKTAQIEERGLCNMSQNVPGL